MVLEGVGVVVVGDVYRQLVLEQRLLSFIISPRFPQTQAFMRISKDKINRCK